MVGMAAGGNVAKGHGIVGSRFNTPALKVRCGVSLKKEATRAPRDRRL
jgi:hypothetical protein